MELLQLSLSAHKFTDSYSHTLDSYYVLHNERIHTNDEDLPPSKRPCLEATPDGPSTHEGDMQLTATDYPEEVVERCSECGEAVPVWLLDSHKDHHLAVELQKQEVPPQPLRAKKHTLDCFFHKL